MTTGACRAFGRAVQVLLICGVALLGLHATPACAEDFESGGLTSLPWVTSGNGSWAVTNAVAHAGSYSAVSPLIADDQSATLSVTLSIPAGPVSFWYKVDSEYFDGYTGDALLFYIDNVLKGYFSAQPGWTQFESASLPAGSHTFRWVYSKDISGFEGADRAWIDDVVFPSAVVAQVTVNSLSALGDGFDWVAGPAATPDGYVKLGTTYYAIRSAASDCFSAGNNCAYLQTCSQTSGAPLTTWNGFEEVPSLPTLSSALLGTTVQFYSDWASTGVVQPAETFCPGNLADPAALGATGSSRKEVSIANSGELVWPEYDPESGYVQIFSDRRGRLTSSAFDHFLPAVNASGNIVWSQKDSLGTSEVWGLIDGILAQLSTDGVAAYTPALNDNNAVVWSEVSSSGKLRVYQRGIGYVSGDTTDAFTPDINNDGDIVWSSLFGTRSRIYLHPFASAPVLVTSSPAGDDLEPTISDRDSGALRFAWINKSTSNVSTLVSATFTVATNATSSLTTRTTCLGAAGKLSRPELTNIDSSGNATLVFTEENLATALSYGRMISDWTIVHVRDAAVDWAEARQPEALTKGSFLQVAGAYYYVYISGTTSSSAPPPSISGGGDAYNWALLYAVDPANGLPQSNGVGDPSYANLNGWATAPLRSYSTWPGGGQTPSATALVHAVGDSGQIDWATSIYVSRPLYVRIDGIFYLVLDYLTPSTLSGSGYSWAQLQQCNPTSGDGLFVNDNSEPMYAETINMAGHAISFFSVWPGDISYELTVIKDGTGVGNIVSVPASIDTSNSLFMTTLAEYTSITLTATAADGSVFRGWSGGPASTCSGTGTCQLVMTQAYTVTATFRKLVQGTVTINAGEAVTATPDVTLNLTASSGVPISAWRISNDNLTWSSWVDLGAGAATPFTTDVSYTLISGDGIRPVYVQFRDQDGEVSESVISDDIELDYPPTGSVLINGTAAFTGSAEVLLTFECTDPGSGCAYMILSNDGVFDSELPVPYSAGPYDWTLSGTEGTSSVYVIFLDGHNTPSETQITDSISLDTTAPSGSLVIGRGEDFTGSNTVALTLTCTDGAGSGCSQMRLSSDGVFDTEDWELFVDSKDWPLTEGINTVTVQFRDAVLNSSTNFSGTIYSDQTAPSGTVMIDAGANFTAGTSVALTLTCEDELGSGCFEMRLSNDGVFGTEVWEAYSASKAWTLAGAEGTNTVTVQFRDTLLNGSGSFSDTIYRDQTAPTGTVAINGTAVFTTSTSVTLTLTCADGAGSGCTKMRLSNDGVFDTELWEDYSASKAWTLTGTDGVKTVYVQFQDSVLNSSTSFTDSITLDTTLPVGSIVVNGGNASTKLTAATLALSCSDIDGSGCSEMRFSNDTIAWSGWEVYAAAKPWTLTTTEGAKTVYAEFRDLAGNVVRVSDGIFLDLTKPVITLIGDNPVRVEEGTTYTELGANVTDNFDVPRVLVAGDPGITGTVKIDVVNTYPGYSVYYNVSDAAGNVATQVLRTVYVFEPSIPAPTFLTVTPGTSYGSIVLAWDNPEGRAKGYEIEESTTGSFSGDVTQTLYSGYPMTYTFSNRAPGTYWYRIRATRFSGRSSWKEGNTFCTVIAAPTSLAVLPASAGTQVVLGWNASATAGVTYTIEESTASNFSSIARTFSSISGVTTTVTQTTPGTFYYRIKAVLSPFVDSPWAPYAQRLVAPYAVAPASLTVPVASSDGSIVLTWSTSGTPGAVYVVQESTASDFSGATEVYRGGALTTTLSGRLTNITYYYRVKVEAANYFESLWTNGGNSCLVKFYAAAPATLTVPVSSSTGSIVLTWSASGTPGAVYVVQESTASDFTGATEVYRGSLLTTTLSGKPTNTTYYYRIMVEADGYLPSLGWTNGGNSCLVKFYAAAPGIPVVPATSAGNQVTISWAASMSALTYTVEESRNSGFTDISQTVSNIAGLSTTLTNNVVGTYFYRVKAVNAAYFDSAWASNTAPGCQVILNAAAPTWKTIPATSTTGNYTIEWNKSATLGAGYELQESTVQGSFTNPAITLGDVALYNVTGKVPGKYFYRIRSVLNPYQPSDWVDSGSVGCSVVMTGSVSINAGAASTSTAAVTLTLAATSSSAITQMRVSKDNITWYSWEPYAATKSLSLVNTDGVKSAYAQFMDANGFTTEVYTDDILLASPPSGGVVVINSGAATTNTNNVNLFLSVTDNDGAVPEMQLSKDNLTWFNWEPFAANRAISLATGPGTKSIYVRFRDASGNVSATYTDSIYLDDVAPTGSVVINGGAATTTSSSVTLTIAATDGEGPVTQMQLSKDNITWYAWEPYATTKSISLLAGDGQRVIYVRFKDAAGNTTLVWDYITSAQKPTGSVVINSGAATTKSNVVNLFLTATDNDGAVPFMRISKDNITWFAWEAFVSNKSVSLTTTTGTKYIYIQYKDAAGNISATCSDTIILDVTPPTGSVLVNNNDYKTHALSVTLTIAATDDRGAVTQMRLSKDGITWYGWEAYATTKTMTLPTTGTAKKTIYVEFKDAAGNIKQVFDSIYYYADATPPTGSVTINGGAASTTSGSVTLTIAASDAGSAISKMRLSKDNVTWYAWEAYATTKAFTLLTGLGTRQVYIQFMDASENESLVYSDAIEVVAP